MLFEVFIDLKFFLMVYLIVIFTFASLFFTLDLDLDSQYEGIGNFSYLVTTFRMSVGDMETDEFNSNEPGEAKSFLIWIIWLIAAIITNIIFLNFIIAVISESYTKVTQKIPAQSIKTKVDLILERESLFTERDLKNTNFFPHYIIVRRVVKSAGNTQN